MNNNELRELVHLLLMCGIMDKTATESGNVTDEEWLRMKTLTEKYQADGGINCEPDKSGDLISRSYLKNLPFERVIHTDFGDTAIPIEEIDNAPTVELSEWQIEFFSRLYEKVRPQSEWIRREELFDDEETPRMVWGCKECGFSLKSSHDKRGYCPNCGAKMKGGKE